MASNCKLFPDAMAYNAPSENLNDFGMIFVVSRGSVLAASRFSSSFKGFHCIRGLMFDYVPRPILSATLVRYEGHAFQ